MAKKKKQKSKAYRLSKTDKRIYKILTVLSPICSIILTVMGIYKLQQAAFEDTRLLAQKHPGLLISLFSGIAAGFVIAVLLHELKEKKQPIFKAPDLPSSVGASTAPIFSRRFWKALCSDRKKSAAGLCAIFLTAGLPLIALLSLNPKKCLYDDGSFSVYNILNENTEQYSVADVEEVIISTPLHRSHRRRHTVYRRRYEIKISMQNGKSFLLLYGDFQSMEGVYQTKNCFPADLITIEGEENIESVIQDMNLNQRECELLYQIFDLSPPSS